MYRSNLLIFVLSLLLCACTPIQPADTLAAAATTSPATQAQTPASAPAEELTPIAALMRLWTSETLDEAWFSDAFLAQVPTARLQEILAQYRTQLGTFERIEGDSSPFAVVFSQGTTSAEITLDGQGRIAGLFFRQPVPAVESLDEAIAQFQELPGDVSVLVRQDGEEVAALNAGAPLAAGSAFKLAVLAALQEQIEAGQHTWDEVVELQPAWKGMPSSLLKDWPDGSPLTLHTLATLMISVSDNTAADALIDIVGRDAVEAYTERNQPFLTTTEAFKLKARSNSELLERYLSGTEAQKRQVLEELTGVPLPTAQEVSTEPTPDVEWFFTSGELCDLMAQVEDLDLMTVQPGPGVTNPANWARVAYKGGSEPGVLNYTTGLETADGANYCVVATINRRDAQIEQTAFTSLYSALIQTLR